jgi:hypothetical protein
MTVAFNFISERTVLLNYIQQVLAWNLGNFSWFSSTLQEKGHIFRPKRTISFITIASSYKVCYSYAHILHGPTNLAAAKSFSLYE